MEGRDAAYRGMQQLHRDPEGAQGHCPVFLGALVPPRGSLPQWLQTGTAELQPNLGPAVTVVLSAEFPAHALPQPPAPLG